MRDMRSTSYDLALLFLGKRNTLGTWSGKIAKRIGKRPSALHPTFHFEEKCFIMLRFCQIHPLESFTEILRFGAQIFLVRKSCRIASFWTSRIIASLQTDR